MDEFELFRVVPVPFSRNGTFWTIDINHDFLIVSQNRRTYQFMSDSDVRDCLEYDNELICSGPLHWHTNNIPQCEWNIFNQVSNDGCAFKRRMHESMWFSIGENKWLFSCREPQALTFICTKQVFHRTIADSGILGFEQNCTVGSAAMEINGRRIFNGKAVEVLVPRLNDFSHREIDFNAGIYNSNFTVTNFTKLEESLKEIRANSEISHEVMVRKKHHYTLFGFFLVAFLATTAFFKLKYNKLKKCVSVVRIAPPIPMPRITADDANERVNN